MYVNTIPLTSSFSNARKSAFVTAGEAIAAEGHGLGTVLRELVLTVVLTVNFKRFKPNESLKDLCYY